MKNTSKTIFIDEQGNYYRTVEYLKPDCNIADKMTAREEILRSTLFKAGYSNVRIQSVLVFTNPRIEVQNKYSGIKVCFIGQLNHYHGYKDVYCGKYIKDGEPVSYREGESTRFFNGKENERIPGKRTEEHYSSDEEKLGFLQRYGWLTNDDDAKRYSAKFKPKK